MRTDILRKQTMPRTLALATALTVAAMTPAKAATTYTWVGGNGTWDDTTTASWSPSGVPANGDTANLTSNTAASLTIDYTATNLTGSGLAGLTIGNSGGGTNTLNIDGTDVLLTQTMYVNPGGAINQTGGAITNTADDQWLMFINGGTYNMGGGIWRQSGNTVGVRGTVNQTNGAFSVNQSLVLVNGVWTISGGTLGTGQDVIIGLPWNVSPPNGGIARLNIDGGTLTVGRIFTIGGGLNNVTSVVNQTAGTVNLVSYLSLGARGTYNLSGGVLNAYIQNMTADFVFNHSGGTRNNAAETIRGIYNFSSGNWVVSDTLTISGSGRVTWTGGTLKSGGAANPIKALNLSASGASWTMQGTTLSVNNSGVGGGNSLVVASGAALQGYGTIQDAYFPSRPDFNGTINNSGRVIANGYGTDRNLDMSRFFYIANPTENTTNNGWFAVNKGTLMLPVVAVASGASTQNWGEAAADTTLDLVNSARIEFTGATAGSLTGQLYATNCAAVPAGLEKPVGIWSFSGVTCTAAVVTFRYDDAAAAALRVPAENLRLMRFNGARWVDLTASLDSSTKTITSSSLGTWTQATTFFAVAAPSSPGMVMTIW